MSLYIILSIVATVLSILAIMKEILIPIIFHPNLLPTVGINGEYRVNRTDGPQDFGNENSIIIGDSMNLHPEDITRIPFTTTATYSVDDGITYVAKPAVSYNYYRLKIENKTSSHTSKADEVYVRILDIYKDKEELNPFNTMKTRWVAESSLSADLSRGEHIFVNLMTVYHNEDKKCYAFPGYFGGLKLALPAGFKKEELSKTGDFCYRIGIYGKNFNGKMYSIKFHFEQDYKEPISNLTCEPVMDKDGVSTCP